VFDVTNKYSFDCLGGWLDNFLRTTGKLPQQGAQGNLLRSSFFSLLLVFYFILFC
jgi:hypothetical protein